MTRRVDFMNDSRDLRVVVLGSLGFSTDFISRQTGLTTGQVVYRLSKAQTKRADYRNGRSMTTGIVLGAVETDLARRIRDRLKRSNFVVRKKRRAA
jgi:hypothetical protein